MLVKELKQFFRENWIPYDFLKPMRGGDEITREKLVELGAPAAVLDKFDSMPLLVFRGLGPAKAAELWKAGARPNNIAKFRDQLPRETVLFLEYKPLERIPHNKIPTIVEKFIPAEYSRRCTTVGSFRRERPTSGDIDILLVTKSADDLAEFESALQKKHGIKWIPYSKGQSKMSGFFRVGRLCVGVDVWIATPKTRHAMMLFSTGSKNFNIRMRFIAKRLGYKLNQYGVWDIKTGHLIETHSEKDIFKLLKMKYRTPPERSV